MKHAYIKSGCEKDAHDENCNYVTERVLQNLSRPIELLNLCCLQKQPQDVFCKNSCP